MSIVQELRHRKETLCVKEVADLLGVAESTVQRWVRNRELPAIRVADTIRFDPGLLAEWLERSCHLGSQPRGHGLCPAPAIVAKGSNERNS
jgi:excisionase family DNA binding protein